MMIQKLIQDTFYQNIIGNAEYNITFLTTDSKQVSTNSCFIAIKGYAVDGHDYIHEALDNGAKCVIGEYLPPNNHENYCFVQVKDSREALANVASTYYDKPSQKLKLIGITGTNGKTSVATLCHQCFSSMGVKCGLLSTIENKVGEEVYPTTHTTLDPIELNKMLKMMEAESCEYVFMECSSHAIDQKRIHGLNFKVGLFTNITHEHLDYHKTFANYLRVKQSFFSSISSENIAISNADDKNGKVMLQNCQAKKIFYSLHGQGNYNAKILSLDFASSHIQIGNKDIHCRLLGTFNVYNLLSVYVVARSLGFGEDLVLQSISNLKEVEGRFKLIVSASNSKIGIVDYAHTPDGLKNILQSIHQIKNSGQKLIAVVGCGGNRDKEKRPMMSKIATSMSDLVVLTTDNPRYEEPTKIIDDMLEGLLPSLKRKCMKVVDREQAIKTAYEQADANDIILVCGKGHEQYQEIQGKKMAFSDAKVLTRLLNRV